MPRVTGSPGRQVQTNPLPGVRRQAAETFESLGGGIGQAQAGLGELGANIATNLFGRQQAERRREAEEARRRADQLAVLEADNQLATWENTRLNDPQKGAFSIRGKAAVGLPETVGAEFDKVAGTIAATLHTDEQRDAFHRAQLLRRSRIDERVMVHVSREIQHFDEEETQKAVANSVSLAIASADDPSRVALELARQEAVIKDFTQAHGIGPEATAAQLDAARTATHVGVIYRLLATEQDRAAQIYFEETKAQISGTALADVEKALERGSLVGEARDAQPA
jgi:hypothetical protein